MNQKKNPHILVAEDDLQLQRMVNKSLAGAGYEVMAISDGSEVLHYLSLGLPDLVILDWNLPNANGLQILQYIHRRDPHNNVKVIVMTGDEMAQQAPEVQYADYFLLKPVGVRELLPLVANILPPPLAA